MIFHKNQRYLEKIGTDKVFIWTKRLAKRKDMREFEPDYASVEKKKIAPAFEDLTEFVDDESQDTENPEPNGMVTEKFLATKSKEQLQDYGISVYGIKINKSKTLSNMIAEILELQKKKDFSENNLPLKVDTGINIEDEESTETEE